MQRWYPGIGDPTVYGWFTVLAYFAAAMLAFAAIGARAPQQDPRRAGRDARFWRGMTVLLVLLGINKQIDLQSLFTQIGRDLAASQGWYADRRIYQHAFIAGLALCGASVIAAASFAFRRAGGWILLAMVGAVALMLFIIVRAASFHHIDMALHEGWGGFRINHALELGGIAVVAGAAWGFRRDRRHEAKIARLHALSGRRHIASPAPGARE